MSDPTPNAARKLIVLCDGTFNDPDDDTNVFRFKNALARPNQLVYYDEGVGVTEEGDRKGWFGRAIDSLAGGAFGSGLSGNVQQAYRWICENYLDGDELYFVGFSRGAYTARSVVGMIRKIGLVRAPLDRRTLHSAFGQYRSEHHPNCPVIQTFRTKLNTRPVEEVHLRFIGVWDTVGALGVPVVGPRSLIARRRWGFHDTRLSSHVVTARQALAIDERRAAFLPVPWSYDEERATNRPDSVEQVWFAGCHSDIGGGAGHLAFRWMLEQAEANGLTFDPPVAVRPNPAPTQVLHESLTLPYRIGNGSVLRPIKEPSKDPAHPRFHNETIAPTAAQLRRPDKQGGESIPLTDRENLGRVGEMRGPKPGNGLTLAYYLDQYDKLDEDATVCCDRYAQWKAANEPPPPASSRSTGKPGTRSPARTAHG